MEEAGHLPVNFDEVDVRSRLLEPTGGRGPDKCIDAVGLEATHGSAHVAAYDRIKQAVRSETDRPHALRQAILSCRSGADRGFEMFKNKQDNCEKVVLKP